MFTCVRPGVDLEILEPGETLPAHSALVRLLVGVCPDVDQHLVPARRKETIQWS